MKRTIEEKVVRLAGRQHGIVTRWQLRRCGMSDDSVDRWLASGALRRLHRGVYWMGPVALPLGREMAAVLACGPDAAASAWTAGAIWQLERRDDRGIHVTVPPRTRRAHAGIRVHRVELLRREVTRHEGIAVTTPARTLLDLASELNARSLERAVGEAFARGLTTAARLRRLLQDRPTARGARALSALLGEGLAPAFTRSEAEESLLGLLCRGGVPAPLVNCRVEGLEVDFHWPAARLVVEVDGYASHGNPCAFENDRRRDALLVSAGWRVMRITWRQITGEPESVLVRIARALPQTLH